MLKKVKFSDNKLIRKLQLASRFVQCHLYSIYCSVVILIIEALPFKRFHSTITLDGVKYIIKGYDKHLIKFIENMSLNLYHHRYVDIGCVIQSSLFPRSANIPRNNVIRVGVKFNTLTRDQQSVALVMTILMVTQCEGEGNKCLLAFKEFIRRYGKRDGRIFTKYFNSLFDDLDDKYRPTAMITALNEMCK